MQNKKHIKGTSYVLFLNREDGDRRTESDSWARDLSDVSLHITIMVLEETERNREQSRGPRVGKSECGGTIFH